MGRPKGSTANQLKGTREERLLKHIEAEKALKKQEQKLKNEAIRLAKLERGNPDVHYHVNNVDPQNLDSIYETVYEHKQQKLPKKRPHNTAYNPELRYFTDEEWDKFFYMIKIGSGKREIKAVLNIGEWALNRIVKTKFGEHITLEMIKLAMSVEGDFEIREALYDEGVNNRNATILKLLASSRLNINEKVEQEIVVSNEETNRAKLLFSMSINTSDVNSVKENDDSLDWDAEFVAEEEARIQAELDEKNSKK